MKLQQRVLPFLVLILAVVLIGTFGYVTFERVTWEEALFRTIYTISTVGFDRPAQTFTGKILTIILIVLGIGVYFSMITILFIPLLEGSLSRILWGRVKIPSKDHILLCGYNDLTDQAIEEISAHKIPLVVIDEGEDGMKDLPQRGVPYLLGDPSEERVLREAGIERANAIILASTDDSKNAFVAMAVKNLNPTLRIVVRLNEEENLRSLKRIGVDQIVYPFQTTIKILAKSVLTPFVADLIDQVSLFKDVNLGQFHIHGTSEWIEKRISDLRLEEKAETSVVALWRKDEMLPNPPSDTVLEENDVLLVLGTTPQLMEVKAIVEGETLPKTVPKGPLREERRESRKREAAREIRARLPKVLLHSAFILGLLLALVIVLPSLSALWMTIPYVGFALGQIVPISVWVVIALLAYGAISDARILFNLSSELLAESFPGIETGPSFQRAVKDILYALLTVIVLSVLSPILSRWHSILGGTLSVLSVLIPLIFIYDAARILYGRMNLLIDRVVERVAGEIEKERER
jgi:voltage-gated potassium channel